jgi:hypothetical protein
VLDALREVKVSARNIVKSKNILMARKRDMSRRSGNETNENNHTSSTEQHQQQEQQEQNRPTSSGSRPRPSSRIQIIDLTGEEEPSNMTTNNPTTNKRATQASEGCSTPPQRKFRRMRINRDSTTGGSRDTINATSTTTRVSARTRTRTGATEAPQVALPPPRREYVNARTSNANNGSNMRDTRTPTTNIETTTQISKTNAHPLKGNYQKASVHDATESEDGN